MSKRRHFVPILKKKQNFIYLFIFIDLPLPPPLLINFLPSASNKSWSLMYIVSIAFFYWGINTKCEVSSHEGNVLDLGDDVGAGMGMMV